MSEDRPPIGGFARLVPELDVFDLEQSRKFWCGMLGFRIAYQRPESRFMYLELQGAQVMLAQRNGNWETGVLERWARDQLPVLRRFRDAASRRIETCKLASLQRVP